ncbi:MAG: hypothetical protein EOM65_16745, partial [Synergistales bacterium]|nr:hypothetical protein [Synergistales bacterium]
MSIRRTSKHINAVLERQGGPNGTFVLVASGLESMEATEKRAKQLAIGKLGSVFVPCRLYPGVCMRAKTVMKLVDPD